MPAAFPISEGDLHGLVDGRMDAARRADALRALAASPADRAKVDAWQEQNDLIRATFAGVEKEPLPLSMRLVAPPTLHCVPTPLGTPRAALADETPRRRRVAAGLVMVTLACGGLVASWLTLQQADDSPQMVDLGLRGPVDESLASIASDAVADDLGARHPARSAKASALGAPLPTTTIPDLSPAGFVFTRAENQGSTPSALVFHYRNAAAEHIAVSVARSDAGTAETAPAPVGRSLVWHRGASAYAVAGTVRPERLRSIAALVQTADVQE